MLTFQGKQNFGKLLRRHRLEQSLWPPSLYNWFEAKGGFMAYDKLTRPMLIQWLSEEMRWPDLNTLSFERKYSRMEQWAESRPGSKQAGIPDPVLMVAFEQTGFLSLPSHNPAERIQISEMLTMIKILQGEIDPAQPLRGSAD